MNQQNVDYSDNYSESELIYKCAQLEQESVEDFQLKKKLKEQIEYLNMSKQSQLNYLNQKNIIYQNDIKLISEDKNPLEYRNLVNQSDPQDKQQLKCQKISDGKVTFSVDPLEKEIIDQYMEKDMKSFVNYKKQCIQQIIQQRREKMDKLDGRYMKDNSFRQQGLNFYQ